MRKNRGDTPAGAHRSARSSRPGPRRLLANLLLLSLSILFALVAAEILLRVAAPQNFEMHPRGMYVTDEQVGYALAPDFSGILERSEFRHAVHTTSTGLRGADLRPRSPTTFRIVCLGDSFTWGFGVRAHEAFPAVLESRLAKRFADVDVQVINAGVPGYGTADELRFLESRIDVLDPDLLVLTFLAENDFDESRTPALERVHVEDGWLKSPIAPRGQPWETLNWIKARSHAASLLSERAGYLAARSGLLSAETTAPQISPEDAARTEHLLERIAGKAAEHGASTIFMFASSQAPVIADTESEIAGSAVVAEAAAKTGAGHIDLPPLLRARPDRFDLYYRKDGHWTAAGHAAAAEILANYIERHYAGFLENRAAVAGVPPVAE